MSNHSLTIKQIIDIVDELSNYFGSKKSLDSFKCNLKEKLNHLQQNRTKPTFVKTPEELLEFNDDCNEAVDCCPNYHNYWFEDRDILLGKVSAEEVLETWSNDDTLWNSGYSEELSLDALGVFDEYKEFKAKMALWEKSNNEGD